MDISEIKSVNFPPHIEEARRSIRRVQTFATSSLIQREKLGNTYNFEKAVTPADKLVELFSHINIDKLDLLPLESVENLTVVSNIIYSYFDDILKFDHGAGSSEQNIKDLVIAIDNYFQDAFKVVSPLTSYLFIRTSDVREARNQANELLENIRQRAGSFQDEIANQTKEVASILEQVRGAAAERGITQEADYFKKEADLHNTDARTWRIWTIIMACVVALYGVLSLFLHKIPYLKPNDSYDTIQLIVGKIVIFFVLGYMLSLCAKNFMSNRHNEIVNRHRQNSLLTYRTLVEGAEDQAIRDAVINHAATSVYSLHDTGYARSSEGQTSPNNSIVNLIPKAITSHSTGT